MLARRGAPAALSSLVRLVPVPDLGDGAAWSVMSALSLHALGIKRRDDYLIVAASDVFADEQAALNATRAVARSVLGGLR